MSERYDWLKNDLGAWCAYALWDQGYISQEKAAELAVADLEAFREFCAAMEDADE